VIFECAHQYSIAAGGRQFFMKYFQECLSLSRAPGFKSGWNNPTRRRSRHKKTAGFWHDARPAALILEKQSEA
jgi:hypothetical protein